MDDTIVRMQNVEKRFSGIYALKGVSLDILRGEVHALIGENGAGKSTLMKILAGIYKPDSGTVYLDGQDINRLSIRERQEAGISMVHQEIIDFPSLNVAENIYAGIEPKKRFGFFDKEKCIKMTADMLARMKTELNPKALAGSLSAAERQLTMIAKALVYNSKLIIMDEPNSALTDEESKHLFEIIEDLKNQGISILYISHRLEEVLSIADRISVMRDGSLITTMDKKDATVNRMIYHMVGRDMDQVYPQRDEAARKRDKDVLFEVEGLSDAEMLHDISFQLHYGEILGIAGLEGSGRTEMAEAIIGVRKSDCSIQLKGERYQPRNPKYAFSRGIGYVPPERRIDSLIPKRSVADNLSVSVLRDMRSYGGFVSKHKVQQLANQYVEYMKIKLASLTQPIFDLSGGNQQKVVISRVLATEPQVLIINEPTRGIDVGAKFEIYKLIHSLADQGIGVIMISSELQEILGVCDNVLTIHEGSISGRFSVEEATSDIVLAAMMTGSENGN